MTFEASMTFKAKTISIKMTEEEYLALKQEFNELRRIFREIDTNPQLGTSKDYPNFIKLMEVVYFSQLQL